MNDKVISSTLEKSREGEEMINRDKWGAIASLLAQGVKKKAIARTLGLHIQTVRKWVAEGGWKPFSRPSRGTKLNGHREWAAARLPQIGYSAVVLLEELKALPPPPPPLPGHLSTAEAEARAAAPTESKLGAAVRAPADAQAIRVFSVVLFFFCFLP